MHRSIHYSRVVHVFSPLCQVKPSPSYLLPLGGRERERARNEIVEQTEDDSVIPKPRSGHLRHVTNAYSGLDDAKISFVSLLLFCRRYEVGRFTGPQSHFSASVNVSAADETVPCGFLLRRYRYIGFQLVKRLRPTPFALSMLL